MTEPRWRLTLRGAMIAIVILALLLAINVLLVRRMMPRDSRRDGELGVSPLWIYAGIALWMIMLSVWEVLELFFFYVVGRAIYRSLRRRRTTPQSGPNR